MEKKFLVNGSEVKIEITKSGSQMVEFILNKKTYSFSLNGETLKQDSKNIQFQSADLGGAKMINIESKSILVEAAEGKRSGAKQNEAALNSPMPGKIFKILVKMGDKVSKGDPLLIVEAMKMEHTIKANRTGVLKTLFFKEGEQVQGGVLLAEIEESNV